MSTVGLPTDTEWKAWVTQQWIQYRMQHNPSFIPLCSYSSKLSQQLQHKINTCLSFVTYNYWTVANPIRLECIHWAMESINYILLEPSDQHLRDCRVPYICCLSDQIAQWNPKTKIASCVRIQFIHSQGHLSMCFTVHREMLTFLSSLSYLQHASDHLQASIQKTSSSLTVELPLELTLDSHPVYRDMYQAMKYIYLWLDKRIQSPSLLDTSTTITTATTTTPSLKQQKQQGRKSRPRHVKKRMY